MYEIHELRAGAGELRKLNFLRGIFPSLFFESKGPSKILGCLRLASKVHFGNEQGKTVFESKSWVNILLWFCPL